MLYRLKTNQSWYHTTMHTRLFQHVYLHTDFNGIGKCEICTLWGWLWILPAQNTSSWHASATFSYYNNNNNKKLAWCWSSPVSVERDEQHEATFMLFILRTPSQPFDKFVFNQRRLPNTPASPDRLFCLRPVFITSPVFIVMSGQWLMRTLKHTIASLSVLVSGWWL